MSHRYIAEHKSYDHSTPVSRTAGLQVKHGELFRGDIPTGIILEKESALRKPRNYLMIAAGIAAVAVAGFFAVKSMRSTSKSKR